MRLPAIPIILFCLLVSFRLPAQIKNHVSLYGGIHRAQATGSYEEYLSSFDSKPGRTGVFGGILFNPQRKASYDSPLYLGLELGGNGWGSETVQGFYGESFEHRYRSFYTNLLVRYRPFTGPVKVSPFLDVAAGPYWSGSVVQQLVAQDEYNQLFRFSRVTRNFSVGAGLGILAQGKSVHTRYIDAGLYYQLAERVASVRRGTLFIDQFDEGDYAVQYIRPEMWKIKLSFTGFL